MCARGKDTSPSNRQTTLQAQPPLPAPAPLRRASGAPTFLLPQPPRLGVAPDRAAQALGRQGPQARRQAGRGPRGARAGGGRAQAVLAQRLGLQRRQLGQQRGARPGLQLRAEPQEVLLARAPQPGAHLRLRGHVAAAAAAAGLHGPCDPRGPQRHGTRRAVPAPAPRPGPEVRPRCARLRPPAPGAAAVAVSARIAGGPGRLDREALPRRFCDPSAD